MWLPRAGDLPVVASDRVSDAAVQEAFIVANRKILPKLRRDVLRELHAARTRLVILADGEEIPGSQNDARLGPGVVATAEANVLCSDGDPGRGESSLIGQLGNEIGRVLEKDASFSKKLADLWASARRRRIYSDNDQITSPRSYWAESVKTYFDASIDAFRVHDRKTLHAQDPGMETLLTTVFPDEGYRYRCPRLDADGNLLGCRQTLQQQQQQQQRRQQQQQQAPATAASAPGRKNQPDQQQSPLRFPVDLQQKVTEPPAAPELGLRRRPAKENGPAPVEPHCKPNEIHCFLHDGHIYLLCDSNGQFRSHSGPPGTRCREIEGVVDFVSTAAVSSEYSLPQHLDSTHKRNAFTAKQNPVAWRPAGFGRGGCGGAFLLRCPRADGLAVGGTGGWEDLQRQLLFILCERGRNYCAGEEAEWQWNYNCNMQGFRLTARAHNGQHQRRSARSVCVRVRFGRGT
ncbi:MAG: hypothetical protein BJ554DRAFT_6621 [Olpidium bornovanus]|uniref:Uncharacterized protein n=1 Tax=Olpidium bornovanus TaxID=278681 RepID=A0A8H7ZX83_9FUNG|nr:MAG: hypothetical protein BJ554DRAFT_6621 [Olpidium bornovanus]